MAYTIKYLNRGGVYFAEIYKGDNTRYETSINGVSEAWVKEQTEKMVAAWEWNDLSQEEKQAKIMANQTEGKTQIDERLAGFVAEGNANDAQGDADYRYYEAAPADLGLQYLPSMEDVEEELVKAGVMEEWDPMPYRDRARMDFETKIQRAEQSFRDDIEMAAQADNLHIQYVGVFDLPSEYWVKKSQK